MPICLVDTTDDRVRPHDARWRSGVVEALHRAGMRSSSARAEVVDWIAATPGPFRAEMIVQQLVVGWGIGSRPTVYRTIDWLRAAGWLARLHGEGLDRAYTRTAPGGHQLICVGCGDIQTLLGLDLAPLLTRQLSALGFELCGQSLEIHGRCRDCCTAAPVAPASRLHEECLP